jgi:hypothetical protein
LHGYETLSTSNKKAMWGGTSLGRLEAEIIEELHVDFFVLNVVEGFF